MHTPHQRMDVHIFNLPHSVSVIEAVHLAISVMVYAYQSGKNGEPGVNLFQHTQYSTCMQIACCRLVGLI